MYEELSNQIEELIYQNLYDDAKWQLQTIFLTIQNQQSERSLSEQEIDSLIDFMQRVLEVWPKDKYRDLLEYFLKLHQIINKSSDSTAVSGALIHGPNHQPKLHNYSSHTVGFIQRVLRLQIHYYHQNEDYQSLLYTTIYPMQLNCFDSEMEAHFMAGEFCLLLPRLISIITIDNISNRLSSIKKLFLQTIKEETALPLLSYFANNSLFREKWTEKIQEFSSFDYLKSKLEHRNNASTNNNNNSGQGKAMELCRFYHSSFGDLIHFLVMKLLDYFPTISFSNSNTLTLSGKTSGASSPMPGSSSPVPNSSNLRSVSPVPGANSANNSVFNSPNRSFFQQDQTKDKAQTNLILSYFHRLCELFTRQITDEDEGMIYVQLHNQYNS
jgi:hypothetical protein